MADKGTRVRYNGPIDRVAIEVGAAGRRVEVVRSGEVELGDHLNAQDAQRRAKALVGTGDWTYVQRDTKDGDSASSDEGSGR